jgi:hypothetical protein
MKATITKILSLATALALLALAGCSDSAESPSQAEATPPTAAEDNSLTEPPSSEQAPPQPFDNAVSVVLLSRLEMSEYDAYETAETVPSVDQLLPFLEKAVLYHSAEIVGDAELWAFDRGELTQEIRHTQLVAYPVMAEGKELYWGADRNTGSLYAWSKDALTVPPDVLESPVVFPTPQSALDYARNHIWDPGKFSVEFTLELIPGDPDAEQYPHYQSQTITFNDVQTATYYIDISSVNEQSYLIHLYEVVMDSPEEGHTATTGWYRIYKNGFVVDDLLNNRWIAEDAASSSVALPEVTVNGHIIMAGDVEAAYKMTNHLNTDTAKDKLQVLHAMVTQRVIAAMFDQYGMAIDPTHTASIEGSYSDFTAQYQAAVERGNESEIAWLEQIKAALDTAREASGLSEAEYEAYNIEQVKMLIMRHTLLDEKFGGDEAAMKRAIEEFVAAGEVSITGDGYSFSAVLG